MKSVEKKKRKYEAALPVVGLTAVNKVDGIRTAGKKPREKKGKTIRRTDYDSAWKDLIERIFPLFLMFLFPQIYKDIDFTQGIEFLSQELRKIIPKNKIGKRLADVVAKVHLKDGSTGCICVFIHVEVQGKAQEDFAERMFVYMYRIYDRFKDIGKEIISLAVLTDDDENYRPDEFKVCRWGYELKMKIPIVKIVDYLHDEKKRKELENSDNPMALVIRAQLKSYEAKKGDSLEKYDIKRSFIRECYAAGYKKVVIEAVLMFLDWLFEIPVELEKKLADEIEKLEEDYKMPYVTSWERMAEKRGKEIGLKRGKELGLKRGEELGLKRGETRGKHRQARESAKRMLADHIPVETISKYLNIPIDDVKNLLKISSDQ